MLEELGPQGIRAMDLLDAIRDRQLSVPILWDLWLACDGDLELERSLRLDADLLGKRPGWLREVASHASADTVAHYDHYLEFFARFAARGGQLPRSTVSVERLKGWLASLPGKTGTRRKYHAGVSSFLSYCVSVGALERHPLRDVRAPSAGKPRDRHLSTEEAQRLSEAQPSPYREFSALIAGTGIEVSVALSLRARDVDLEHREIRARGTKTHNRDRVAKIATWAWPSVKRAISDRLPDAALFDGIPDRWHAQEEHTKACKVLGIHGYTMRDARHTWAVRMARAGVPIEQISRQLGHKDAVMALKVYAVYAPSQAERDHWEQVAAARDVDAVRLVGAR